MNIIQLFSANQFDAAEKACWDLIRAGRGGVIEHHILGAIYVKQGKFLAAHEVHQMAERFGAVCSGLFYNDGLALLSLDRQEEAVTAFRHACRLDPLSANNYHRLGQTLMATGQLVNAEQAFRQALKQNSSLIAAYISLGEALYQQGKIEEAIKVCRKATKVSPRNVALLNNLASLLIYLKKDNEAQQVMNKAVLLGPDLQETLGNLAGIATCQGRPRDAADYLRKAILAAPDKLVIRSDLIFTLAYLSEVSAEEIKREAEDFGRMAGKVIPLAPQPRSQKSGAIRVGLVSGDLCNHPVGFFIYQVLPAMRAQGMEIYAYSTAGLHDQNTSHIKKAVDKWTSIAGMGDLLAAQCIRRDQVEILIDLSGHTGFNRLPMFAYRPAPVQIASWIGFSTTSGMAAMDYMLADPYVAPPGEDRNFTEKLWRLPRTYQCFSPPHDAPDFQPAPCLQSGRVTFGSRNNLAKMSDEVVAVWANILKAVDGSRLLMRTKSPEMRKDVQERFARHMVTADRLTLMESETRKEALSTYGQIDIALDTFPYTGGTTTAEALWMGVPVITLRGDRFSARMGVSMLCNAGLPDWVAESTDDYVAKAVAFASNREALAAIRQDLQANLADRPLFNTEQFAKDLHEAFEGMLAAKS